MFEERVARMLAANNIQTIQALQRLVQKIVTNILEHEDDPKYRRLRTANKSINSVLHECNGALDVLLLLGFQQIEEDGDHVLKLPDDYAMAHLIEWMKWFNCEVEHCIDLWDIRESEGGGTTCAECIVQIRYREHKSAKGGFAANNTVREVLAFAKLFYRPELHDRITIRETHNANNITGDVLDQTLQEMGWVPGVVLISTERPEGLAVALGKQHVQAEQKQAELREQAQKRDVEVKQARVAEQKYREVNIQRFQADRERKRQQHVQTNVKPARTKPKSVKSLTDAK